MPRDVEFASSIQGTSVIGSGGRACLPFVPGADHPADAAYAAASASVGERRAARTAG